MATERPSTSAHTAAPQSCHMVADLAILTIVDDKLQVMVTSPSSASTPQPGRARRELALPTVDAIDVTRDDIGTVVLRRLVSHGVLRAHDVQMEQLRSYRTPDRDESLPVITVGYVGIAKYRVAARENLTWEPVAAALSRRHPRMPSYCRDIVTDAVTWLRSALEHTTIAAELCPPEFTVPDLHHVYETIWDCDLEPRNFHRKVIGVDQFLVPTGMMTVGRGGRPASLYRRGTAATIHPPIVRPP